jgi:hypothetical protein
MNKLRLTSNFIGCILLALIINIYSGKIYATQQIPSFPMCPLPGNGDKAHYDTGLHQIVGQNLLEGKDDVYSLENGNYVQCFCNPINNQGIQTNWFRTNEDVPEWYHENGIQWNLGDYRYSAQNIDYNCNQTTPTPTISPTPTGEVNPTPTGNIFPTPTSAPNQSNNNTGGGGSNNPGSPFVCNDEKPGTPTLISLTQNGSSMKLVWTPADKATTYAISYGLSSGNYIYGILNVGNVTEYTINSLDPNQRYYAAVRATNGCTQGDLSNEMPKSLNIGGSDILGVSTLASTGVLSEKVAKISIIIGLILLSLSLYGQKTQIHSPISKNR